jgi:hypothetical protein
VFKAHVTRLVSTAFVLALCASLPAAPVAVIIVAGQSNALNWHAAGRELPPQERDGEVLFFHESGAPPSRGVANATSGGTWTTLRVQRQDPFAKYERDFFGPEMTLARELAPKVGRLAVIKTAYFGTTLAVDWNPAAKTGNQLFRRMQEQTGAALDLLRARGEEPRVVGFFWMQGETDGASAAHAAAYDRHLAGFIRAVRAQFGDTALPFVLGRVGPPPARGYSQQQQVRLAQVRVAEATPRAAWVDTDDLPRDTDGVHLMARGVMLLGHRMAQAWLRLDPANRP